MSTFKAGELLSLVFTILIQYSYLQSAEDGLTETGFFAMYATQTLQNPAQTWRDLRAHGVNDALVKILQTDRKSAGQMLVCNSKASLEIDPASERFGNKARAGDSNSPFSYAFGNEISKSGSVFRKRSYWLMNDDVIRLRWKKWEGYFDLASPSFPLHHFAAGKSREL